jgi:hypothetical protein
MSVIARPGADTHSQDDHSKNLKSKLLLATLIEISGYQRIGSKPP